MECEIDFGFAELTASGFGSSHPLGSGANEENQRFF
jgi:hypothetical protein